MSTHLRLLQAGLDETARHLERWQREDALRAAKLLDAAARSAEPGMREAFLTSLRKLRQAVREADLAAVLESGGSAEALIDLIPWDSVTARPLQEAWKAILLNLVAESTAIAAEALPAAVTARLQGGGERAADWARNHAAQLVQAITTGQQLAIRDTIGRVFAGDAAARLTPAQAAKVIRATVGLTAKQAQAVTNFRAELVDDGRATPKVDAAAGRYADKLRAYRADMIARTETVGASQQGQQAQWAEAAAQGLIPQAQVERVWYVTEDDRLDPIVCAPMDGQRTTLAGFFTTGDGREIALPPAHPGCRCTVILGLPSTV